jgi:SAM-dependent methyltransferase
MAKKDAELKVLVRNAYGDIARKGTSCCESRSACCRSAKPADVGRRIGYTEKDLQAAPPGSNLGLGCGNPIALAEIKAGETVLDLGSGAGFDSFLASRKVGPSGKVIGVDMTPEMVERAKEKASLGAYGNVEFRLGELESLPAEDNSVDVILSNCVINLVPDKKKAFEEAFRALKSGGRLIVSDIILLKDLPSHLMQSAESYVGCLSGAVRREEYLDLIRSSGFENVAVIGDSMLPQDALNEDPMGQAPVQRSSCHQPEASGAFASSIIVRARKPTV